MKQAVILCSIVSSVAACGQLIPTYPPLNGVPPAVPGEIDGALPQVKASIESDFPAVKILRLESGQRVWTIEQAPTGVATARFAMVHLSFQVAGKCYYQPRMAFQEAGASGWGGIQTKYSNQYVVMSKEKANPSPLSPNPDKRVPYMTEGVTAEGRQFGGAYPVDCGSINTTLNFRPCTPFEASGYDTQALCAPEEGATPVQAPAAAAAPAPAASPAPAQPAPAAEPAPAPAPAAPVQDASAVDPKAPPECKTFVEKGCNNPKVPADKRGQICTQYVAAVNQLMAKSPGQAVEACKALLKSSAAN